MSVGSVCRRPARVARARDSVAVAAKRMLDERVGALVIVEGERPTGMLTDRDLCVRVVAEGRSATDTTVGEVASPLPVVLQEETSISDAAQLMSANGTRRLPVVDAQHHVVGLITGDDLVRLLARELATIAEVAAEQSPRATRVPVAGAGTTRDAGDYCKPVTVVARATSALEIACIMRDESIGCVVVVEEGGEVAGIVTDRDLAGRVAARELDPLTTAASDVMSTAVFCVDAAESLQHIVEAMAEAGVRRVPILRDRRVAGIVTYDDVIATLGGELHALGDAARRARETKAT